MHRTQRPSASAIGRGREVSPARSRREDPGKPDEERAHAPDYMRWRARASRRRLGLPPSAGCSDEPRSLLPAGAPRGITCPKSGRPDAGLEALHTAAGSRNIGGMVIRLSDERSLPLPSARASDRRAGARRAHAHQEAADVQGAAAQRRLHDARVRRVGAPDGVPQERDRRGRDHEPRAQQRRRRRGRVHVRGRRDEGHQDDARSPRRSSSRCSSRSSPRRPTSQPQRRRGP